MVTGKSGHEVCRFCLKVRSTLDSSPLVGIISRSDTLHRFGQRKPGQGTIPIHGVPVYSGSSNADAGGAGANANASSARAVAGDLSGQCLPGGGVRLTALGPPRSNPRPHTAGPLRAQAVVAGPSPMQRPTTMQSRRATVDLGGVRFKYEGRDHPPGPFLGDRKGFRPPSPNPPGFR